MSVGASIGLDAIGAPPILQSFVPGILGQLAASATGSTGGGGGPGPDGVSSDSRNIFGRIIDTAKNFGGMVLKGVQNVISFGAEVVQQGFEKTVDLFSSVFNRQTQEIMYESSIAGPVGTGSGWKKIGSFTDGNGFKTVHYENTSSGDTMVVQGQLGSNSVEVIRTIEGRVSSEIYKNLGKTDNGLFGFGSVAFAQETPDGVKINQTVYGQDNYDVSLSDATNGNELYKYQVNNGEVSSFEQSLQAFAYGNDVTRLREANSDDVVLADIGGFQKSQLDGLSFRIDFTSGISSISASLVSEDNTQAVERIQAILQETGQTLQEFSERLQNSIELLGSRTDSEIAAHKEAEINKVLSSPEKLYVIHTKTAGSSALVTRQVTRLGDSDDGVNHSALAFKDENGDMFIIEIQTNGSEISGLDTDVLVRPFEEWAAQYIDIDVQALPISSEEADNFRRDIIFGKYVDEGTMLPKVKISYDFPGALGAEGFGVPVAKDDTRRFCSELVCDIITEGTGQQFEPIDGDGYISPNELRQRIEEWIKNEDN